MWEGVCVSFWNTGMLVATGLDIVVGEGLRGVPFQRGAG